MLDESYPHEPLDWRRFLQLDAKAVAAIAVSVFLLGGLLGALPHWLRVQERADFQGVAAQTAPGTVATVQISPVSQGGGGLFNAVTVAFAHREIYYALPPQSRWQPKRGDPVVVTYRIGRSSGKVQMDAVTPK